jgi:hypothetical protein
MNAMMKGILSGTAVLLLTVPTLAHAQSVVFNGAGSSALFLELGEGATTNLKVGTTQCLWTSKSNGTTGAYVTDPSSSLIDAGQAWVAWKPGTDGTCSENSTNTNFSTSTVYAYIQEDSVVGNRALFNSDTATYPVPASGSTVATANLISSVNSNITETGLPYEIATALNSNHTINAAGTDIRPEDAQFAINRAIGTGYVVANADPCGGAIANSDGTASNYLGLGYANGSKIYGYTTSTVTSPGTFNVVNFTVPSGFTVIPVGAVPVVVAVNSTSASGTGFNNSNLTNLSIATLAGYLDGSIGYTGDALGDSGTGALTTVFIREPLSGTYNTMEYSIPNSVARYTSQDVGYNQLSSLRNCKADGSGPKWNDASTALGTTVSGSYRERAIGTGNELKNLFASNSTTSNALGYSFWSVSNFAGAGAASHARYLKVNGVDPIESSYGTNGVIPTQSNGLLSNVSFANLQDYPIWSLLRLVANNSTTAGYAQTLATAAQNYSTSSYPDFVNFTDLTFEHSHFTPPGVSTSVLPAGTTITPQNGLYNTLGASSVVEAGGDVGGTTLTTAADYDYYRATGSTETDERQ